MCGRGARFRNVDDDSRKEEKGDAEDSAFCMAAFLAPRASKGENGWERSGPPILVEYATLGGTLRLGFWPRETREGHCAVNRTIARIRNVLTRHRITDKVNSARCGKG